MKGSNDALYEYHGTAGEDHGGWLLSYADLITLLICFFVVLLAASTMQVNRFDLLKSEFTHQARPGDLRSVKANLDEFIQKQQLTQSVATTLDQNGLNVRFTNTVLFPSGQAEVTPEGQALLTRVTESLRTLEPQYRMVIEGYTDEVPIHTETFHSNWDLSAGRAIGVLQALAAAGIDPKRISIQGFADTRPAESPPGVDPATIDVEQRRALNRRVVIRVY